MAKGRQLDAIISIAGRIDPSLKKSIQQSTGLLKEMDDDINRLSVGFDTIGKVGKLAFATVAAGATAFSAAMISCIDAGKDFESQMSAAEAVSGASVSEMEELEEKALDLASTTKWTATEIAKAYEYMGMAGWDTEEMLAGIPSVLNLASAAGQDLGTTADMLTDDMTAFGLSITTENIEHFADVMAATATSSNTNVAMMGETFKYAGAISKAMGYDFEEVAVATGLMANAGIKSSQAGTVLRSWITRLASPTKQAKEALDELGITVTNEDGSTKDFMETVYDLREAMQGLTDTEKTRYATLIAGKVASTGMLAVVDAEEKDINDLRATIEDCSGAAQKMADIRLDNLEGDITIMKSAFDGLKLAIYDEVKEPAREAVQGLTEFINKGRDELPDMAAAVVTGFKDMGKAIEPVAEGAFTVIKDAAKWAIDNKRLLISTITGVAAAFASFKIMQFAKGVAETAKGFKLLLANMGPVGWAITGITTAVGALAAAIENVKLHDQELIAADLNERFGDIHLSLENIEKVADRIIRTDALSIAERALSIVDEASQVFDQLNKDIEKTSELNWKVEIGIGLDEEEQAEYQESIESFIKNAKEYVGKKHYAVDVALDIDFPKHTGEGQMTRAAVDKSYAKIEEALEAEGKYLQEVVNNAFADGIFDIDEAQVVQNIQADMARIAALTAESEQSAKLHEMSLRYGVELDPDTQEALKEELAEQAKTAADTYTESYLHEYQGFELSKKIGDLTEEEFLEKVATLDKSKLDNVASAYSNSLEYITDTALEGWKDNLGDVEKAKTRFMEDLLALTPEDAKALGDWSTSDWKEYFDQDILEGIDYTMNYKNRQGIIEYLGLGAPTEAEIENIVNEYVEKGQPIPEKIADEMLNYALLQGMNGGDYVLPQSIIELIANGMVESADDQKDAMDEVGKILDNSVANGIQNNSVIVDSASEKAAIQAKQKLGDEFAKPMALSANVALDVHVIGVNAGEVRSVLEGIKTGREYSSGGGGHYALAKGGFTHGVTIAGEDGQEAVISFDPGVRERNLNIWKIAGERLGATQNNINNVSNTTNNSGGANITFAPNITVNGNADHNTIMEALREGESEFVDLLEELGLITKGRGPRYAYGG